MATQRIAIIGGGPGGLMLARLLQRQGKCPVVLERDRHAEERPQGGSLDMHDETGQYAMEHAGLREAFMAVAARKIREIAFTMPQACFCLIVMSLRTTGQKSIDPCCVRSC